MQALVKEFWTLYIKVFNFVFIPFCFQLFSTILYFSVYLQHEKNDDPSTFEIFNKLIVYITAIYFGYLEWLQFMDKASVYFSSFTNWVQMISTFVILL